MDTKIVVLDGIRYTLSRKRIMGKTKCLCLVDDEMYGEVFEYDGRFDDMTDHELDNKGLMDETYAIICAEPEVAEAPLPVKTNQRELYMDKLLQHYPVSKEPYNTPTRTLSAHKRTLVSSGLPVDIASNDNKIEGTIFLNDKGDLIVSYTRIGELFPEAKTCYLLDAKDSIIKKCHVIERGNEALQEWMKENPPFGGPYPQKERIICAANYYNDGIEHVHEPKNIKVGFVTCGRRHHNCISTFAQIVGFPYDEAGLKLMQTEEQGFLTDTNRFVDRKEAYKIAFLSDQIIGPNKGCEENSIGLTSEDLY